MVAVVILTAIVTALTMLTFFLGISERNVEAENVRLVHENSRLHRRIREMNDTNWRNREKAAYNRGVTFGRNNSGKTI